MINFRKASKQDCKIYFDWANDEVVREQSFNSNVIAFETHNTWFKTIICNPKALLLVFENENKKPIGQVRFQNEEKNNLIKNNEYLRRVLLFKNGLIPRHWQFATLLSGNMSDSTALASVPCTRESQVSSHSTPSVNANLTETTMLTPTAHTRPAKRLGFWPTCVLSSHLSALPLPSSS